MPIRRTSPEQFGTASSNSLPGLAAVQDHRAEPAPSASRRRSWQLLSSEQLPSVRLGRALLQDDSKSGLGGVLDFFGSLFGFGSSADDKGSSASGSGKKAADDANGSGVEDKPKPKEKAQPEPKPEPEPAPQPAPRPADEAAPMPVKERALPDDSNAAGKDDNTAADDTTAVAAKAARAPVLNDAVAELPPVAANMSLEAAAAEQATFVIVGIPLRGEGHARGLLCCATACWEGG